jgi:hypothetical protein
MQFPNRLTDPFTETYNKFESSNYSKIYLELVVKLQFLPLVQHFFLLLTKPEEILCVRTAAQKNYIQSGKVEKPCPNVFHFSE